MKEKYTQEELLQIGIDGLKDLIEGTKDSLNNEYEEIKESEWLQTEPIEVKILLETQLKENIKNGTIQTEEIKEQYEKIIGIVIKFMTDMYNIERKKVKTILKAIESLV